MKTNKKLALQLVEQLIERAESDDEKWRKICYKKGKSSKAVGESFMCFHLKALKELLENDDGD